MSDNDIFLLLMGFQDYDTITLLNVHVNPGLP